MLLSYLVAWKQNHSLHTQSSFHSCDLPYGVWDLHFWQMLGHTLYIYAVCPLDNNKRPILIRIIVTFHAKTYYNGFPFSNGIRFRTRLKEICIRSNDLGHLFKKICIPLNGLIARSIETSSRSSDLLTHSIKTSNQPTNQHFCAHEINYSRWCRKCRRTGTTKWVPQKVTPEYHRNPKIICCVFLTSNTTNQSQN